VCQEKKADSLSAVLTDSALFVLGPWQAEELRALTNHKDYWEKERWRLGATPYIPKICIANSDHASSPLVCVERKWYQWAGNHKSEWKILWLYFQHLPDTTSTSYTPPKCHPHVVLLSWGSSALNESPLTASAQLISKCIGLSGVPAGSLHHPRPNLFLCRNAQFFLVPFRSQMLIPPLKPYAGEYLVAMSLTLPMLNQLKIGYPNTELSRVFCSQFPHPGYISKTLGKSITTHDRS
jgi:hypothetical protein